MFKINFLEKKLPILFGLAPLFLLTVRSWANVFLIISAFLSFIFLLFMKSSTNDGVLIPNVIKQWIVITFMAPTCAIILSSLLRGTHVWADYDSASRFLVAIAIFLFAARKRFNIANVLQYTAPLSLVFTLLHQIYFPQPKMWGPDRMSTYFSDPLVFGYISLTFSLISLVSINLLTKDSPPVVAFKLLGTAIGIYLSLMSGSRTGWLAAPIVIAIWLYQQERNKGKCLNVWMLGLITTFVLTLCILSFMVNQRLALLFHEIFNYSWIGIGSETSVGLRITFLRIAFDMFMSNPIIGFGDTRYELISLPPHIYTYASPESLRIAFTAGFHNEIVTNAIRYGLAGLIATVMLFVVPVIIFMHQLHSASQIQRANALIGIVFTICVLISSFSTEVFDLKFTTSFYALTIALLCASAIAAQEPLSSQYQGNPLNIEVKI